MDIPGHLLDQIRDGNVVLFLGAGASIGAPHKNGGERIPDARALGGLISDRFLDGEEKDKPLSTIADYAINQTDLHTLQKFIHDIFISYEPAEFHKKISEFKWAAIVTTNYDQIIESAYAVSPNSAQNIRPVIKTTDRIEELAKDHKSVLYLKLHGCISHYTDVAIPMILTIDQYVNHRKGRVRLFERFKSLCSDYAVIYVGYRLEDPDFRQILSEIVSEDISRPRHYIVTPSPSKRDIQHWEQKRVETLSGTFEDFIGAACHKIPEALRNIKLPERVHEIERKSVSHQRISPGTISFLSHDCTYLKEGMAQEKLDAKAFYHGASYGWSAIESDLDFRRGLEDQILDDIVLIDESDRSQNTEFHVIKGYAGAGKTVLLKRLAWDVAVTWEKVAIFLKAEGHITVESIQELCELTQERIYLFVDRAGTRASELERVIPTCRSRKLKLTVVCAERINEWNTECKNLKTLVDNEYELRGLSGKEIDGLLDKLNINGCLGSLKGQTKEEQRKAFLDYANRQLLVAMYEVTSGRPFEDIVFDEYKNIVPEQARNMYLIVCSLNRLQVPVRAGIIKRLTDISFNDFKDKFFGPLEGVVHTEEYSPAMDMAYRARHPWIAEKVFEKALPGQRERFELYMQLLSVLDPGYQPDRVAYREIVKAKNLLKDFQDQQLIKVIYDSASDNFEGDAYLLQQRGLFELRRANGSLDQAYQMLSEARKVAPHDSSIKHSLSELELQRALRAKTDLEKGHHLRVAAELAGELTASGNASPHAFVTLAKVGIQKLTDLIQSGEIEQSIIGSIVREIEKAISDGLQLYPDDEFIRDAESKLAQLIFQEDRAIKALEKAYSHNKASPYIAKNLARLYEGRSELERAKAVLLESVGLVPNDKPLNAALARIYTDYYPEEAHRAELHWRRSFTEGDSYLANNFWFARQLFVNGKYEDSLSQFRKLKTVRIDPDMKRIVRGLIKNEHGSPVRYFGTILDIESNYGVIRVSGEMYNVHMSRAEAGEDFWDKVKKDIKVEFSMGFNYYGPTAKDILIC